MFSQYSDSLLAKHKSSQPKVLRMSFVSSNHTLTMCRLFLLRKTRHRLLSWALSYQNYMLVPCLFTAYPVVILIPAKALENWLWPLLLTDTSPMSLSPNTLMPRIFSRIKTRVNASICDQRFLPSPGLGNLEICAPRRPSQTIRTTYAHRSSYPLFPSGVRLMSLQDLSI